jgi:hypothetical protein
LAPCLLGVTPKADAARILTGNEARFMIQPVGTYN